MRKLITLLISLISLTSCRYKSRSFDVYERIESRWSIKIDRNYKLIYENKPDYQNDALANIYRGKFYYVFDTLGEKPKLVLHDESNAIFNSWIYNFTYSVLKDTSKKRDVVVDEIQDKKQLYPRDYTYQWFYVRYLDSPIDLMTQNQREYVPIPGNSDDCLYLSYVEELNFLYIMIVDE